MVGFSLLTFVRDMLRARRCLAPLQTLTLDPSSTTTMLSRRSFSCSSRTVAMAIEAAGRGKPLYGGSRWRWRMEEEDEKSDKVILPRTQTLSTSPGLSLTATP